MFQELNNPTIGLQIEPEEESGSLGDTSGETPGVHEQPTVFVRRGQVEGDCPWGWQHFYLLPVG